MNHRSAARPLAFLLATLALAAPPAAAQSARSLAGLCAANARANEANLTAELKAVAERSRPATVRIETEPQGVGSGFLISSDGLVMTAHHVIAGATAFKVVTDDKERFSATVVGFDEVRDLALVKVDQPRGAFPFLEIETVAPKVGDAVFAIGNSCNDFSAARYGKVTALERDIRPDFPSGLLVSTMPLAPGDSGGPVFNAAGRVIGVSDAIGRDETGFSSFVAPLFSASKVIADLRAGVKREVPLVGISGPLTVRLREDDTVGLAFGALIPGLGADKAGLRANSDVITAIDGRRVRTIEDLKGYLRTKQVGDKVELTVRRENGETVKVTVTLSGQPSAA